MDACQVYCENVALHLKDEGRIIVVMRLSLQTGENVALHLKDEGQIIVVMRLSVQTESNYISLTMLSRSCFCSCMILENCEDNATHR